MLLEDVKGVGKASLQKLNKLGIFTADDLIGYLPKSYIDLTKPISVYDAEDGQFLLLNLKIVKVTGIAKVKGMSFFKAYAECLTEPEGKRGLRDKNSALKIVITWFNQPYQRGNVKVGDEYYFFGKVRFDGSKAELANPQFERADARKNLVGIMPVYKTRGSIAQSTFRNMIKSALKSFTPGSVVSDDVAKRHNLQNLQEAYYLAHFPTSVSEGFSAQRRLAVEDTVNLIVSYRILQKNGANKRYFTYDLSPSVANEFVSSLPFELTFSQKKALSDIFSDLEGKDYMNRILMGDVGSGKTVVAFAAVYFAIKCGYQAALMAPTEILASQHFGTAKKLLEPLGIKIAYLSGSTPAAEKKAVLKGLVSGETDFVIGTHALIQKTVKFFNLGLVVIDEQHKFGVKQKAELAERAKTADVLTLSATPIPRAMALILYEDLKQSTIYKRSSQSAVKTALVPDEKLADMYAYLKKEAKDGNQSFVVCPRITDSEGMDLYSAENIFEDLENGPLAGVRLGLLHGKMSAAKKDEVMREFSEGKIDVLVSTTVVEVGIDVPNATNMVILDSDRFGLATLHQLRGRVGRGDKAGYCFLHSKAPDENERLAVLKKNDDGFRIAEIDFDMRGGGDFLGTRQCGDTFDSNYAIRIDTDVIKTAKRVAEDVYDSDFMLQNIDKLNLQKYAELIKDVGRF